MITDGLVFRKKRIRLLVKTLDRLLSLFLPNHQINLPQNPKKILLCHLGGLGDLTLLAPLICSLQAKYSQVGLLVSHSVSQAFSPLFPHITFHSVSADTSLFTLCKAALHERPLLEEIASYEIGIDLQPFFPNAIFWLYRAKIPIRIGYPTAGLKALLTHSLHWQGEKRYLLDIHLQELGKIGIELPLQKPQLKLPERFPFSLPKEFFVFHMVSSKKEKNWTREGWTRLAHQLKAQGKEILLTGYGVQDAKECLFLAQETGAKNFCNLLSFPEYALLLKRAKMVITVDSVSLHLAALQNTPTVVLFSGVNCPALWIRPKGSLVLYTAMQRMDQISVDQVMCHIQSLEKTTDSSRLLFPN